MNPHLKRITTRKLIAALEADGFQWARSKGSHRVYRHPDGRRVVVSYHRPGATFPVKTLQDMLAGTRWTDDDLARLGLVK